MTNILSVEENLDKGISVPEFDADPEILQVVMNPETDSASPLQTLTTSPDTVKVIRRFAYNFRLPMISVQMFHVVSEKDPNALHLVEIFEARSRLSTLYAFGGFLLASYWVSKR
eukprot:CAMPEP_0114418516 /NCGR_PEP_ID=MMETSP0103-20121206/3538_1 /TAXON_ID=37642 ORGANISM="Paraphysomonas imperforata, Strain PA2" /NCGR_SAMPLE_ID=MMETSP0103 /ASSEMBLY_ACC=CAM_ASM_000201 /LENGTH=113 /DNA_ID=CAMNT_0001586879 /DNA_START=215 /DNA_END=559 /DNA_ORIENTATION=-